MGYLTNKYVKDKNKKFWIQTAIDIFLIMMLIFVGISARAEFDNGARFMLKNVPAYCINQTLYQKTLDYYGVEGYSGLQATINTNAPVTGIWNP
jgi:hypothetical protein